MKSGLTRIAMCMLAVALLCSVTFTPAFAASIDPERAHQLLAESAEREAGNIEAKIDALPDDAGLAEKDEIEAIRKEIKSWDSVSMRKHYPDALVSYYISDEHMRKLEAAEERVANPQATDQLAALVKNPTASNEDQTMSIIILVLVVALEIIWIIQALLAYGTAYRKTKAKGDSGVSLFGWMLLYDLAALVPGLGFYLWHRSKKTSKN